MRYAIISDIHSNLEALEAVLKEADRLGAERIFCLGDIVGYNANPNECVELIKKHNITAVMGNHDSRVAELEEPTDFNPIAQEAVLWTRHVITERHKEFLKSLPRHHIEKEVGFMCVHGWIDSTDSYIFSELEAEYNFRLMEIESLPKVVFFGHTHVRIAYTKKDGFISSTLSNPLKLEEDTLYLINPGSVGQPRDGDTRSSFLIYDTSTAVVTFHRVGYDIESCVEKIKKAGLPPQLWQRLQQGW